MKEDINALDEIHKGTCMGEDAISFVLDKVSDNDFKKVLNNQYNDYESLKLKIEDIYPKYNEGNPHETSAVNKAMTWTGIEMKTINDSTTSKLAELVMQGVNMGIIEGRRILNNNKLAKEVNDILKEYVDMQEQSINILKEYL